MKLKYIFTLLLFSVAVLTGLKIFTIVKKEPPVLSLPTHKVNFYDDGNFIDGINKVEQNFEAPSYKIAGAVVNHHLLAGYMIADVFKKIAIQDPKVLIILGPNHYEKGDFNVLTSKYAWETKYGIVEPDENIIGDLIVKNLARPDEETLPADHATSTLLPFIKFYMPSVKVVQLLVSKKLTKDEAEILSNTLTVYAKDGAVIIASTDFSHYLTVGQANAKDDETLKAINGFDYNTLFIPSIKFPSS